MTSMIGRARRVTLGALAVLALSGAASAQVVERPAGEPVATDAGLVAGKTLASDVRAYLGVPYAKPPVRELRWREPQPVAPWKGVYNADRKSPECIQVLRAHNLNHYFGEEATSEDCLYLNIWTPPAAKAPAKAPVLVWIYGGGFTIGSAGMANYDGEAMARKGVVFVNLNYRVGALGFLAHPELTAESPHHASGNYALLDQVAALKWIKANIARFGGDPDNVTIMGQSAGAASVSYLQASPLGKGLFQHVVAMSGSAVGSNRTSDLAAGEATGVAYQKALGAASLDAMRQLPADRILSLQADCQLGCAGSIRVGPIVDGYVLPKSPREIFVDGTQNDVPIMVGFTHDESGGPLKAAKTVAAYEAAARDLYKDKADAFLKAYPVKSDDQIRAVGGDAARETAVEASMRNWALLQAKTGKAPVYIYMFSRVHPYTPGVVFADHDPKTAGAYHTADVPYWFQTQDSLNLFRQTRTWTAYDRALSDRMSNAIIAFATSGDPSAPDMAWPRWTPKSEKLMEFGDSVRVLPMNSKRLDFAATLPQPAPPAPVPGRPRD